MESPPMQRRYPIIERPLSARDYDMPVGWWGWNWEPPVPMSIAQLLEAGNMDARTAALCGMTIESHGSMLIAAEQPHSGKTTTLTALLDFLPNATRRVFPRGGTVTALPLVTHDEREDSHTHDEAAEIDLLHSLRRSAEREGLAEELDRRSEQLTDLVGRGCREIPEVRAALASYRGEPLPNDIRGDPVE